MKPLVPQDLTPPLDAKLITTDEGLAELGSFLATAEPVFGLDLESSVEKNFYPRRIRTIQIGNKQTQYVIDLLAYALHKLNLGWDKTDNVLYGLTGNYAYHGLFRPIVDVLRPVLESDKYTKVGHFLEFEYTMLKWCFGIRTWGMHCTFLAEKILYAGEIEFDLKGYWALDDLVGRYFGLSMDKELQTSFDLATPLTQKQIEYAAIDVRAVLAIRDRQLKRINAEGLAKTLEIENNCIGAFGDMHLNGMLLDAKQWTEYTQGIEKRKIDTVAKLDALFIPVVGVKQIQDHGFVDTLEKAWRDCPSKTAENKAERAEKRKSYQAAEREYKAYIKDSAKWDGAAAVNYSANNQLRNGLIKLGFKEKQLPNTEDRTLARLAGNPAIDGIRELRKLEKLITTYGMKTLKAIDPDTGRIHSRIIQIGAETGRPSSREPNLLNIPKTKEMRQCFVAPSGYQILSEDCSGQELRIMASYSNEKAWIEAFNNDWDVHSICAEMMDAEEWKSQTEPDCIYQTNKKKCKCVAHLENRDKAKSLNFLVAYGGSKYKLADNLNEAMDTNEFTPDDAEKIMQAHKREFPTLWAFLEDAGVQTKTHMEARTMIGRRRKFIRPTWDMAIESAKRRLKKKGIDREPVQKETSSAYGSMFAAIEREGRNMKVQGLAADMMKLAMGACIDKKGAPFMWHRLESFGAKLCLMPYDEFVIEAKTENAQEVFDFVAGCITRAGAEIIDNVVMISEGRIGQAWSK